MQYVHRAITPACSRQVSVKLSCDPLTILPSPCALQ